MDTSGKEAVEVDGVKYITLTSNGTCTGCAFRRGDCKDVACVPGRREDRSHVIFVLATDLRAQIRKVKEAEDDN